MPLDEKHDVVEWPAGESYLFVDKEGSFAETAGQCWKTAHTMIPKVRENKEVEITKYLSVYTLTPTQHYHAGVALKGGKPDNTEGLSYRTLPGGKYARFILRGSFSQLPTASGRVHEIVNAKEGGLDLDDTRPYLENYLNDPDKTPEADLVTEILVPIKTTTTTALRLDEKFDFVEWPAEEDYLYVGKSGAFKEVAGPCWTEVHANLGKVKEDKSVEIVKYVTAYTFKPTQHYYAGVIVKSKPEKIVDGYSHMTLPGGKYARFILRGSYMQLGEASGRVHEIANSKDSGIAVDHTRAFLEHYLNNPTDTAEADLVTEILVPVKEEAASKRKRSAATADLDAAKPAPSSSSPSSSPKRSTRKSSEKKADD